MLTAAIKSKALDRHSAAVTNFDMQLPEPRVQLAKDALIDPYIFDFLTLDKPFRERELETGLVEHLEQFLLELGAGFAFVGRQVHLDVAEEDFYSNEYITSKIQFMGASASIAKIGTGPGASVCRRCRARILCPISPIGLPHGPVSPDPFGQKGQTEI